MLLVISKERTINDLQLDFSTNYPYLKLEFYKLQQYEPDFPVKKHLLHTATLRMAGLKESGLLEIRDEMTVADLEKAFHNEFGLEVQVSRKSGMIWLETTMTDSWTLAKQNEHGREISISHKRSSLSDPDEDVR